MEAYLFVYFTGNHPSEEQLRFAVSMDGYNWQPLNNGCKVLNVDEVARWKCIRDPHILRGEDGRTFYMVMTDMKCTEGWASNDGIVMMKSKDLVNWKMAAVDFPARFPKLFSRESCERVWAPQTIYDHEAGKYMIYYSLQYQGQDLTIFYSYANKDFTDITEPVKLFDFGHVVLDADIVKTDTCYHMFLSGIDKLTAKSLRGPWVDNTRRHIQPTWMVAEGPAAFRRIQGDWCLLYDCFRNGELNFSRSNDLEHFELMARTDGYVSPIPGRNSKLTFTPRHGTVMAITMKELQRLLKAFPSDRLTVEVLRQVSMPEGCRTFLIDERSPDGHRYGMNPIFKHEYTCDPAPVVWGDTLWLFTGHDVPGKGSYNIPEWSLFSTTDLRHWRQYPAIMQARDITWNRSRQAYAAHAVRRNGKYYFYFSTNGQGIGVATSDRPEGPYKDALGKQLITNDMCPWATHSWRCIDPAVFIDDDGQAWLFWGNGVCYYAKLKSNMTELDSEVMRVDLDMRGFKYTEAPWVHKHNGKYYLSFAIGFPEKLAYAVADEIDGHYETKGILAEVAGNCNTTHPGIVQFRGEWYLFTHDGSLQNGSGYTRSVGIYKLNHNNDGTIDKVNLDSRGIW